MDRREFIKVAGLLLAGGLLVSGPWSGRPVLTGSAAPGGLRFRGAPGGEVHASTDGGRTWRLHARLGEAVTVTRLVHAWDGGVLLVASYAGRPFPLRLAPDGKHWLSQPGRLSRLLGWL